MKKTCKKSPDAELRPEYDFAGGVRGKYAERFSAGSNIVVLDPDVAEAFPSSESANKALRSVMKSKKRDTVQTVQTQ